MHTLSDKTVERWGVSAEHFVRRKIWYKVLKSGGVGLLKPGGGIESDQGTSNTYHQELESKKG